MSYKRNFLVEPRPDLGRLMVCLNEEFSLVRLTDQPAHVVQPNFPVGNFVVGGVDCRAFLQESFEGLCGLVAATHALIDEKKPAGCLLWNTVTPRHATIALTCRARGIPVFEVSHWAISSWLHGHFENAPEADFLFCTREHAEFMAAQPPWPGKIIAGGRPQYDGWRPRRNRRAVRKHLGLDPDQLYVLKTSTWTHTFTDWSHEHWKQAHDAAIIRALQILQQDLPVSILWSTRGQDPKPVGQELAKLGLRNIHLTHDEGIRNLVEASDLVLTQKSGAAVDAVVAGRPAVIVDFHPQLDDWRWKGRGILSARTPERVVDTVAKVLTQKGWRGRILREGARNQRYFGCIPGSSGKIAKRIIKECQQWTKPRNDVEHIRVNTAVSTERSTANGSGNTSASGDESGG